MCSHVLTLCLGYSQTKIAEYVPALLNTSQPFLIHTAAYNWITIQVGAVKT